MLTQLAIQDYAIVDRLELDLTRGMTAITGETGAGKSILLGALGLCLGERADAGSVRHAASEPTSPPVSISSTCPQQPSGSTPASCLPMSASCVAWLLPTGAPRRGSMATQRPLPI